MPGYYAYATQSDAAPGNVIGSGANQANYRPGQVFSVTQVTSYSSSQNYLTDVGAFSGSGSFYGTFDQTGMLYDVNDLDGNGGPNTGRRGGYWYQNSAVVQSSSFRFTVSASTEVDSTSFRLASPVAVPEPSTYCLALAGLAYGGFSMWRRKRA